MNPQYPSRAERPFVIVPLLVILLYIGISVVRVWRAVDNLGTYTGCHDCFWLPALGHDAWLFSGLLAALALRCWPSWRIARFLGGLIAGLILVLVAGDLAVDTLLSQRLYLGDVLRFGKHVGADLSVVRAGLLSLGGMARIGSVIAAIVLCIALCGTRRGNAGMARVFTVAALLIGVFSVYALSQPFRYINRLLIDNVVEVNLPQGRMQAFSPAFIRAQQRVAEALPRTCSPASAPSSGSVIVVLVESLSAWHSHLLGSDKDWTPQLDTIARENHYFTHFYANGISTSMAEMSVISGHLPLTPAGKNYMEFGDYADTRGTLPDIAHRSGREAAFFTTGDVSFLDLGPWLHGLGFDRISGNDDAFYAGMPRWQFGAAEDAALYDRFLDWLDKRDNARPFVSALLTVSTHPPYVDPYTGKIDPERSFKYADAQIGRFYAELKRRGFFDHGVLMVFGDHRTMTPLHADEFAQYGDRAYARVPLIVAGAVDMPTLIEAPFQQADIPPSIAELVGLESCRTVFTGSFLRKDPQPPQYVIHARGDDRNRADVYWNADDLAGYAFDGDASRWLTPPPPDAETVAAWINTQRVATHDGAADTQISAPASTTVPASR